MEKNQSFEGLFKIKIHLFYFVLFYSSLLSAQSNKQLYSWGYNSTGQLSVGDVVNKSTPQLVSTKMKFIAGGYDFSIAIDQSGKLFGAGANGHGQCGDSDYQKHLNFRQIGKDSNWTFVSTGWNHAIGINNKGYIYGWGSNLDYELGLGPDTIYNIFSPTRIGKDSNWVCAAAGSNFSLAINSKGELYSWGNYIDGRLGLGSMYDFQNTPQRVGLESDWVKVAAGRSFSIAINKKGQIFSFGNNRYGQLGLGNTIFQNVPQRVGLDSNFIDIAAGWYHILAVKSNGELYACGRNNYGQLGIGNQIDQSKLVRVGTLSNWESVAAGSAHSLALTKDGELFSFGDNSLGQLGVDLTKDKTIPNKIGTDSTWDFIASGTGHCLALSRNSESAGMESISDIAIDDFQLNVFPVPTKALIYVDVTTSYSSKEYTIYSINGKKISCGILNPKMPIDVSNLSSGLYLIQVRNKFRRFVIE